MPQMFLGIGIGLGTGNSKAVIPDAPANTAPPTISGTPAVGSTLTASPGTWTGTAPITYEYQWDRNGSDIAGATGTTHVVDALDEGAILQVKVTATNVAGSDVAYSLPVEIPLPGRTGVNSPKLVTPPTIEIASSGNKLHATRGVWTGQPTPTLKVEWLKNGVVVQGETQNNYIFGGNDFGKTFHVKITATNTAGSVVALSNAITLPASP